MTGGQARVAAAVADGMGSAVAVIPFLGTITVDDAAITAQGTGVNSVITAIRSDATTAWTHALHSGLHCDLRAVELADGRALAGGLTSGPLQGSGDPCDLGVQTPQDPVLFDYSQDGTYAATVSWDAAGAN